MTKVRIARIATVSICAIALWGWTAGVVRWLFPDDPAATVVLAEIAVSLAAVFLWKKTPERDTPWIWLVVAAGFLLFLIFFVEVSCGGRLQFVSGRPSCAHYEPGFSMVFDISAFVMTLAAPACALYAALLQLFDAQKDHAPNA